MHTQQSGTIDFKRFLAVKSLVVLTLLSWQWGTDPTTIESVTAIKWGSELPAHHTIISIVWSWVASNPCALACNIWWVREVFSVKPAVSSPASHVQPERPSLPTSLPEDWASSMHQWHQPSQGTCSMPNQWFIRTQLAGRHGASCHMPRGSTAICTHSPLLYSQPSLTPCSLCMCVASVLYSTGTGLQSVPFLFRGAVVFVLLKQVSRDLAALSSAAQVLSWEWVTMTFSSTHVAPVGCVWNTHPSTEVWGCGAPDTVNLRR